MFTTLKTDSRMTHEPEHQLIYKTRPNTGHFHVRSKVVLGDTSETQSTWEQQISVISLLRPNTCKQDQQQIRYIYNKSEYYDNEYR